jgi:TolB-like protein/class 3 adenylate cyclase
MADENYRRKLTAILSADVAGYSRLMGDDEVATVSTLKSYREIITENVKAFNGRVVDSPGDNILSEFRSIVDAVKCAVAIQEGLREKNDKLPENRKMNFRIGVNLGDVIQDGDRIYGDGVNIAARIEGLADPGGVALSGTAFDNIRNKLECGYQFSGEHAVKNIANPVRVYKILTNPECAGKVIGEKRFLGWMSRRVAMALILSLAILTGGLVSYFIYLHQTGRIEHAVIEKMAFPLPDKPSIAVLPFDNMSADPAQEYFSDGITDEVITALAKIPHVLVIARNSTFVYKGKPVKIKQVSQDLGVHYVLEGGVRRDNDRIRINVQLIDAIKGYHVWAERYEGKLVDIFKLQDQFTQKIVAALAVKLTPEKERHIADRGTKNVEAYDAYLQGLGHYFPQTSENLGKALPYLKRAVELDPDFAIGHATLAGAYSVIMARLYAKELGITDVRSLLKRHLELAFKNPSSKAYQVAAWGNVWKGQTHKAMEQAERAFALEPGNDRSCLAMAGALIYSGRSAEAIPFLDKAMRINPEYPAVYLWWLGVAQFCEEQMQKAASTFERTRTRNPHLAPWFQIAAYEYTGRGEENPDILSEYLKIRGWKERLPIKSIMQWYQFKDQKDRDILILGLRKAGFK